MSLFSLFSSQIIVIRIHLLPSSLSLVDQVLVFNIIDKKLAGEAIIGFDDTIYKEPFTSLKSPIGALGVTCQH